MAECIYCGRELDEDDGIDTCYVCEDRMLDGQ